MNDIQIISFIIITYNRPEETINVTNNILYHINDVVGYEKEIIIINNNSTAPYKIFANFLDSLPKEQRSKINYLESPENLGVPRGRNLGMQLASGEIMVFTDDDAEFIEANVIEVTLDIFNKYEESENVKIIAFREQNYYSGKFSVPTKSRHLKQKEEFFTNYFIGCAHVIKKELISEIGDYITTFTYGVEEYDLAYKCIEAGNKIFYSSKITVLHKKSNKGRASDLITAGWMFENKVIIAYIYLPFLYVISHFTLWSLYFLFKSKGRILVWSKIAFNLPSKIRIHKRKVLSEDALKYINNVKGRFFY